MAGADKEVMSIACTAEDVTGWSEVVKVDIAGTTKRWPSLII